MKKIFVFTLMCSSFTAEGNTDFQTQNPLEESISNALPPNDLYDKVYSILKNSRAFHNYTHQDIVEFVDEVEAFKIPEYLENRFPYYLAGHDFEDRPVWVTEMGKYKFDDLLDKVTELYPVLEKMAFQAGINVAKSFVAREKEVAGVEITQYISLVDFEGWEVGYTYKILQHPEIIEMATKISRLFGDIGMKTVGRVILINVNHAVKIGIDISRPILGQLIEKLVVLGTNKYKWKAELRRYLPEESLPSWYGGSMDFKPLAVYG